MMSYFPGHCEDRHRSVPMAEVQLRLLHHRPSEYVARAASSVLIASRWCISQFVTKRHSVSF